MTARLGSMVFMTEPGGYEPCTFTTLEPLGDRTVEGNCRTLVPDLPSGFG